MSEVFVMTKSRIVLDSYQLESVEGHKHRLLVKGDCYARVLINAWAWQEAVHFEGVGHLTIHEIEVDKQPGEDAVVTVVGCVTTRY